MNHIATAASALVHCGPIVLRSTDELKYIFSNLSGFYQSLQVHFCGCWLIQIKSNPREPSWPKRLCIGSWGTCTLMIDSLTAANISLTWINCICQIELEKEYGATEAGTTPWTWKDEPECSLTKTILRRTRRGPHMWMLGYFRSRWSGRVQEEQRGPRREDESDHL